MTILGTLSHQQFLSQYWQTKPLLLRDCSYPDLSLTPDDLAGLACELEVESRLVIHDETTGQWHCEHGPFDEGRFAALPARAWTLLVQAVDQSIPDVALLRSAFDFLPSWRLDDVMISVAAEGGGVGPHFDSYDVFLLQLSGTRHWQIGQRCDAATPLVDHPDLKVMRGFDCQHDYDLEPGDMLYLPPGLAHYGTATSDECVTCSIGFRSPSYSEVAQHAVALLDPALGDQQRFRDPVTRRRDDPFLISAAVDKQLEQAWLQMSADLVSAALPEAFGREVTEPRYPELVQADCVPTESELRHLWDATGVVDLAHHPSSRFAYRVLTDSAQLFVDGEAYFTTTQFARGVCHGRLLPVTDAQEFEVLLRLVRDGSVSV